MANVPGLLDHKSFIKCLLLTFVRYFDSVNLVNILMFAFAFTKAFDSLNHYIQLIKSKQLPSNPYIYNGVF